MLIRYDPWSTMRQLRDDMNRAFGNALTTAAAGDAPPIAGGDWSPAVDIKEDNESFVISADVPGVEPGDIEITMENGVLTIKGERKFEAKDEGDNGYRRVERAHGSFLRRFSLPETADTENISAKGKDGVLAITVPKKAALTPKRIAIAA